MKNYFYKVISFCAIIGLLSGCARDLSHSTYTSNSTINIVLPGKVLTKREVKIVEHDRLADNSTGAVAGALAGGAAASGGKGAKAGPIVGAAIAGGIAGSLIEGKLGTAKGVEYVVKVDTSKLKDEYFDGSALMRKSLAAAKASGIVTVVQSVSKKEAPISEGQNVLLIISEERVRIVPDSL
ncbi:MAG: hypothetical protein SFT91_03270 [Rickettsiaceae bacterium]|nr:hypothetical protein [Rickettsiaceae bacterium]